jgi:hypothetical protein
VASWHADRVCCAKYRIHNAGVEGSSPSLFIRVGEELSG